MKFRARWATAAVAVFALVGAPMVAAASAGDDAGSVVQPEVQPSVPLKAPSQKDVQKPDGLSAAAATCMFPVDATNSMLQSKTVTSRDARYYSATSWTNLECGQLTVTVPRGRSAGLVVRTDASADVHVVTAHHVKLAALSAGSAAQFQGNKKDFLGSLFI